MKRLVFFLFLYPSVLVAQSDSIVVNESTNCWKFPTDFGSLLMSSIKNIEIDEDCHDKANRFYVVLRILPDGTVESAFLEASPKELTCALIELDARAFSKIEHTCLNEKPHTEELRVRVYICF